MTRHFLPTRRGAFTLVEVTLAIGVAAFSLLAIFGLLPVGVASNQAALEQTAASGILSAVVADLRSTPPTTPRGQTATTGQFKLVIPANPVASATPIPIYVTADGASSTTQTAAARYLLTVNWLPNGSSSRASTLARVRVSWPAAAGADHPLGSVESLLVLDRN